MKNKYIYKLYSNCIFTQGFSKGMIGDLERNLFYTVPNTLLMLFNNKNELNTFIKGKANQLILKE
jgi:hypothetical protein